MIIDTENKKIRCYHWEACCVANYLAKCTNKNDRWSVEFIVDSPAMETMTKERM